MPRPPSHDALFDAKFITNYFIAGCVPPGVLVVETSQPPLKDLALLIVSFDLQDILQEIFDPNQGRQRKPARHGRKRRRGFRFPDHNAAIGNRIRAAVNPGNAFKFGPIKFGFRLLNLYEGIAITAALVEGLTDVGFETLWGVMKIDPNHCTALGRLSRTDTDVYVQGGVGSTPGVVGVFNVEQHQGFFDNPNQTNCISGDYSLSFETSIRSRAGQPFARGRVVLWEPGGDILEESTPVDIYPGDTAHRSVWVDRPADHGTAWGWYAETGFVEFTTRNVFAFRHVDVPWPWK